jgi:putative transposase
MEKQQSKKREKKLRLEEIIPDDDLRTDMLSRLYKGDPLLGDKGIFTNLLQSFVNAALEGEMDNFLQDSKADSMTNRRNGHTSKSLRSTAGPPNATGPGR